MQFQVPQFIDVEDKIFGPFSFKEFLYLIGGAGGTFVLWKLLPWYIAIIFIIPVAGLALALVFFKVNSRPFIFTMQAWFNYMLTSKFYLWQQSKPKTEEKRKDKEEEIDISDFNYVPRLTNSKLKDISWSLDVLDKEKK